MIPGHDLPVHVAGPDGWAWDGILKGLHAGQDGRPNGIARVQVTSGPRPGRLWDTGTCNLTLINPYPPA
jgi:hypothetical protein